MTTLSAHITRAIHNKGMQAVYGIAAEYDVPVEDVIALLGTTSHTPLPDHVPQARNMVEPTPSQPESTSLRTTADTPAVPPASETDGGVPSLSSPSVEPIQPDTGDAKFRDPTDWEDEDNAQPVSASPLPGDPAGEANSPPNPVASSSAAFSSNKSAVTPAQVKALHSKHPTWPARLVGRAIGISPQRAVMLARSAGVTLPTQPEYDAAQRARIAEELRPAPLVQPVAEQPPAAAPQPVQGKSIKQQIRDAHADRPDWTARQISNHLGTKFNTTSVAMSEIRAEEAAAEVQAHQAQMMEEAKTRRYAGPKAEATEDKRSLADRVTALRHQRPNWTDRLIAAELGAPIESVRRTPPKPAAEEGRVFAGKAELQQHYGDVAKRLGKPA